MQKRYSYTSQQSLRHSFHICPLQATGPQPLQLAIAATDLPCWFLGERQKQSLYPLLWPHLLRKLQWKAGAYYADIWSILLLRIISPLEWTCLAERWSYSDSKCRRQYKIFIFKIWEMHKLYYQSNLQFLALHMQTMYIIWMNHQQRVHCKSSHYVHLHSSLARCYKHCIIQKVISPYFHPLHNSQRECFSCICGWTHEQVKLLCIDIYNWFRLLIYSEGKI